MDSARMSCASLIKNIYIIKFTIISLLQLNQFFCDASCLSVCLDIGIVVGIGAERAALHGLGYDIAHLQETAAVFQEGSIDYLVGSIDDAWHVATLPDGFEGQRQTAELLEVGLKELQRMGKQIKAVATQ